MANAGIEFTVVGLNEVLASIDKYSAQVQQGVDDVLTATAIDTVTMAQELAPVDDSNLRQNIGFINEPFKKSLYSNAAYSAYVEFGTGTFVDVPTIEGIDLPAYAMTFFVNGKGHMLPHPFFFPAIQKNVGEIPALLEKVLNK